LAVPNAFVHSAGGHFGTANIIIAKIFVRKNFTNDGRQSSFQQIENV
jgi:hypothetical protein